MRYRSLFIVMLVLMLAGCAQNLQIQYALDDIPASSASSMKNSTLSVETLADIRKEVSENAVLFMSGNLVNIEGVSLCVNAENKYEQGSVPRQITSVIVEHLKKKAIFKDVVLDNPASADLKLTGSIRSFYGQQAPSNAARVGSQFGLIGALLTANVKTHGTIRIELSNLSIVDKQGAVIKKLEDVVELYEGDMQADGNCLQIYANANAQLKNAVEKLAQKLANGSV